MPSMSKSSTTTPEFWLNLQSRYDLQCASRSVAGVIARDVRPRDAA